MAGFRSVAVSGLGGTSFVHMIPLFFCAGSMSSFGNLFFCVCVCVLFLRPLPTARPGLARFGGVIMRINIDAILGL